VELLLSFEKHLRPRSSDITTSRIVTHQFEDDHHFRAAEAPLHVGSLIAMKYAVLTGQSPWALRRLEQDLVTQISDTWVLPMSLRDPSFSFIWIFWSLICTPPSRYCNHCYDLESGLPPPGCDRYRPSSSIPLRMV
jgi:hypothetical protein